jgi:glycosyltransferase involved in cell wall biosynthesis
MRIGKFLSLVIPVYNDEEVIQELYTRCKPVLDTITINWKIIFVDDGSKDDSFKILMKLQLEDSRIGLIKLARNFGQQNAITAGLDMAKGDIVVIMDSDLQDRPEDIPLLLKAMEDEQKDMAIAKWISRDDSLKKKFFSKLFFTISQRVTKLNHEPGLGVFRAIKRSALEQIIDIPEKTGTILSLMYWSGIEYAIVELKRDPRFAGSSGYNLRKMLKLTADRIFSYSLFPIRIASTIGVIIGIMSFLFGIFLIIRRIIFEHVAAGWTSTLVVLAFLFGLNFFFLGIIGEYLGRIYLESKGRPKYVISRIVETEKKKHEQ